MLYGVLFLIAGCGSAKKEIVRSLKDNGLVHEKTIHDYGFKLQYMPSLEMNEDTALLYFRLNITSNTGMPEKGADDLNFSYGLDTLFSVVGSDTIAPVDVSRVANGKLNGTEYMIVFDKQIMYQQQECKLLFKDWLFTQQVIYFPLSVKAIAHIDSLSQKI